MGPVKAPSRHALVSHERRVRRAAARHRLSLLKVQKANPRTRAHGGYMLRRDGGPEIVFGNARYPFDADLADIEAFLARLDASEGD